jgi:hypothetical protein
MSKFIKLIRKIPYKRRQFDAFCKEFNRMGNLCDKNIYANDIEPAKFYQGAQFGMVYAGHIFGDLTEEEIQNYIDNVLPHKTED